MQALIKQFISLAIPTVLSALVYTVYTLIDGIFIGRYGGAEALAALNLVVPMLYVPYAMSVMIGVGGATLVARLLGQEKQKEAGRAFSQALITLCVVSVVLSLSVLSSLAPLARLLGASPTLAPLVTAYLGVFAWFSLFANAFYAMESFLRVEGHRAARFGLGVMLLGALINIVLDYYLIAKLQQGMRGAALATGISLMMSSFSMLFYLMLKGKRVRPVWTGWAQRIYVGTILYNGSSELLSAIAPCITIYAFNQVIFKTFGQTGLAAYAVLEYMALAAMVMMGGLVQSMQPMVSFYRGSGETKKRAQAFYIGAASVLGFSVFVATLIGSLSRPLTLVFLPNDAAAWPLIEHAIVWQMLALMPAASNWVISGYLTAIESPGPAAIIALLRSWVLLLGLLYLLPRFLGRETVWYTLFITEFLTLFVSVSLYWYKERGAH